MSERAVTVSAGRGATGGSELTAGGSVAGAAAMSVWGPDGPFAVLLASTEGIWVIGGTRVPAVVGDVLAVVSDLSTPGARSKYQTLPRIITEAPAASECRG
jgi:hypothetical protein